MSVKNQETRSKVSGNDYRERLLTPLPVGERRLQLAGISTAVCEGGQGPAVVLLHGPGGHAASWLRVIPGLATSSRVVAPDLPGHGASEGAGPIDFAHVMTWLDELIAVTCPEPPVLVGHALGGAIAAHFAGRGGERLASLVLVDTLGLTTFQPTPQFGAALGAFLSNPSEDTHDGLWKWCAFDLHGMREQMGEQWDWLKAYHLDRAEAPELRATRESLMQEFGLQAIPPSTLETIGVPTMLVWGRHDRATPLPVALEASRRYGWPISVVENAGDDPPLERPEEFQSILDSVLKGSLAQEVFHDHSA